MLPVHILNIKPLHVDSFCLWQTWCWVLPAFSAYVCREDAVWTCPLVITLGVLGPVTPSHRDHFESLVNIKQVGYCAQWLTVFSSSVQSFIIVASYSWETRLPNYVVFDCCVGCLWSLTVPVFGALAAYILQLYSPAGESDVFLTDLITYSKYGLKQSCICEAL
jgi:hypothetical protein